MPRAGQNCICTPYVWYYPCQKCRIHTIYAYVCMVLTNPTHAMHRLLRTNKSSLHNLSCINTALMTQCLWCALAHAQTPLPVSTAEMTLS